MQCFELIFFFNDFWCLTRGTNKKKYLESLDDGQNQFLPYEIHTKCNKFEKICYGLIKNSR